MDLTARNRFSHRLNVLRNASMQGTGLSQLKPPQETEEETDQSSHTAVVSTKGAYLSEPQRGEEAEGSMNQYDLHGHPLHSENLMLESDVVAQGTQPYPIEDVAHVESDRLEPLLGGESGARKTGDSDDVFTEATGSKEPLEPAQALADDSELEKAEGSNVDDGDFIDYEDVQEVEGGSSSATSTLQGDTIDVHAVQDHEAPNESIVTQTQGHPSPYHVEGDAVVDDQSLHEYVNETDIKDVGVPIDGGQPDATEIPSQNSDDESQVVSGQFDEDREASENDQEPSISQDPGSHSNSNVDDQQGNSALYEDDAGSYWQDKSHEHADQTEGDAGPVAGTNFDSEVEDYSSTRPLYPESSGSQNVHRNANLERFNDLEVASEQEDADRLLANDDNDNILRPSEEVNTRLSLFLDEAAQTQEDDDEITYEDEEYGVDSPHEPPQTDHKIATSPGSLKRVRSLHEEDDTLEEDLQGRNHTSGLLRQEHDTLTALDRC